MLRTRALSTALLALVATGIPQAQETSTARFERDLAFARGLAGDFGLFDLAEERLEELARSAGLDGDALARIDLERGRIGLLKARAQARIQGKWELVKQALARIGQQIVRIQGEELDVEARLLYLEATLAFGEILEYLLEERVETEARAAWIGEADAIYRSAIKYANDVRAHLAQRKEDPEACSTLYRAWMIQGELTKDWALIVPEADRAKRLSWAKSTLTDFIFGQGSSIPGTRSMILLAQCVEFEGNYDDAKEINLDVIEEIWTHNLRNPDKEFSTSTVALLTRLMEEAYFSLIRLHNRLGQTNEALAAGAQMVARIEEIGREFEQVRHSLPQGMRALLEYAGALRAAGETERAIRIAAEVSTQAGDLLPGLWARRFIGRILEDLQDVQRLDPWLAVQARAGWLELKDGVVREVRGLEQWGETLASPLRSFFERIDHEEGRFSLDWHRIVCHYAYACYRAGVGQSQHLEQARALLALARGPEGFARLKQARPLLAEEERARIGKLAPAEREAREQEWENEREALFQFFLFLAARLEE